MTRLRADLWLVLITIIWGSTFVVVKNTLGTVGPFVFVTLRFGIAALGLALLLLWRPAPFGRALWRDGILSGLLLWASYLTQTLGLQTTTASKAAFITGLNVVLVPIFAALLLRRAPAPHAAFGVVLATVGLAWMTLDVNALVLAAGDLWVMLCAALFALHIIAIAHFSPRYPVLPYTLVQLLTVAVLAGGGALIWERGALLPPPAALPAILYMGLVATAFVVGIQTFVQRYTTPTHTALIFALEPVFAALFAILLAQEVLGTREWLGGGLILLGMLVSEVGDMIWKPTPPPLPGSSPSQG